MKQPYSNLRGETSSVLLFSQKQALVRKSTAILVVRLPSVQPVHQGNGFMQKFYGYCCYSCDHQHTSCCQCSAGQPPTLSIDQNRC